MTFITTEQSIEDAEPVELYEFIGPTPLAYRFASSGAQGVISFGGNDYTPIALQRSDYGTNSTLDLPEVTVDIPVSEQIVKDYVFGNAPRTLELTVYRVHGAFSATLWTGVVESAAVTGNVARFKVAFRLDNLLDLELPRTKNQAPCNWLLYSSQCTVSEAANTFPTTVSTVTATGITVASVDGNPDQFYRGGGAVDPATGERKLVTSQVGTTVTLLAPFRSLVAPNAVNLVAGCDRSRPTCFSKFDNVANFGGTPDVAIGLNIWQRGITRKVDIRGN